MGIFLGCIALGYFLSGGKPVPTTVAGVVGLVILILIIRFLSYIFKAGQIAMMVKGVTEGTLPEHVLKAGKAEVKERFVAVSVYFGVTSLIRGIFSEITRAISSLASAGSSGGAANTAGSAIAIAINTIVAYLSDCCLGWVFYNKEKNAFKSTCEGALLFFKNWKTLLKNLGRIFGMGLVSFIIIGGAFGFVAYKIFGQYTQVGTIMNDVVANIPELSWVPANSGLIVLSVLVGLIFWCILHGAFVRPFVLVGVLKNYMQSCIRSKENDPNADADYSKLEKMSPKFRKAQEKARSAA